MKRNKEGSTTVKIKKKAACVLMYRRVRMCVCV